MMPTFGRHDVIGLFWTSIGLARIRSTLPAEYPHIPVVIAASTFSSVARQRNSVPDTPYRQSRRLCT
jgi:hypothetical protein